MLRLEYDRLEHRAVQGWIDCDPNVAVECTATLVFAVHVQYMATRVQHKLSSLFRVRNYSWYRRKTIIEPILKQHNCNVSHDWKFAKCSLNIAINCLSSSCFVILLGRYSLMMGTLAGMADCLPKFLPCYHTSARNLSKRQLFDCRFHRNGWY